MEQLIHSGDYWVLLISIVSIGLLVFKRTRSIGILGLLVTTVYIGRSYNHWRALLHVLLMGICTYILKIALRKYAFAANENHKQ